MKIIIAFLFVIALVCWSLLTKPISSGSIVGKRAPTFVVPRKSSKVIFPDSFTEKPTIINFWNSSCTFCRKETPDLNLVFAQAKTFYFLSINTGDDMDTISSYIDEMGVTFPVLLDKERQISRSFRVLGTPETFLISKDGIIKHHLPGPTTAPELLSLLATLN